MKKKFIVSSLKLLLSSSLIVAATGAMAQSSGQTASVSISIPNYSDQQLDAAGCNRAVWKKMTDDYIAQSQTLASIGTQAMIEPMLKGTPAAQGLGNCFDNAARVINQATEAYSAVMNLLSGGGINSNSLMQYGMKVAIDAGCSMMNSYVGSLGLGDNFDRINSFKSNVFGTSIGNSNINVGEVLRGGGYEEGRSSVDRVDGSGLAGQVVNKGKNLVNDAKVQASGLK